MRGEEHQAPGGGGRRRLVPREVDVLAVVHDEVLSRAGTESAGGGLGALDDGTQEAVAVARR